MLVRVSPRWRLTALGGVAALLTVLAVPAEAAVARPTGPLSRASGAWFGALVNPDRGTPSSTPAEVKVLEDKFGRKLDIVNHFYTYTQIVGTQGEVWDIAGGRTPMVTWGATDTNAINNGSQDAFITSQAQKLKQLNAPVFLRYYHEPEGAYRKNIVHTPADYIAAWKHARALFAGAGATNVIWMFTTTAFAFRTVPNPSAPAFYPGDANVDWIAADGYNFAPNKPGSTWLSFQTVLGKWYAWASTKPRPLMVSEYGVMEDSSIPNHKATWYKDMMASVKTNMPLVQGVVAWSTENVKNGAVFNWNVDSSTQSFDAWKAMGIDPYFMPPP
ncbi:MAG: glycosyl hydrolase [Mycobacteriales bacterium]